MKYSRSPPVTLVGLACRDESFSRGALGSWVGGDWLRQEIQFAFVHGASEVLAKKSQTLTANKTAGGTLSPIQMKDLGFVLA